MNDKLSKNATIALLICAIVLLFLFSFIPLVARLVMPFQDYNIFKGFTNSPWVGLRNFEMLFNSFHFNRLVLNTVMQNLATLLIAVPLAAITIYMLARIKCHKMRTLLSFVIAIPALIPSVLIGNWIIFTYGREILNMNYTLLYGLIHGIKLASFAVIASWAMSLGTGSSTRSNKNAWIHTVMIVAIMVLVALSRTMSTDLDFANMVSNPIIYEQSDTLSSFIYRIGFMNMNIGQSTATWAFKFIVELFTTFVAAGLSFLILKLVKPSKSKEITNNEQSSTPFIIISSIIALTMLGLSIMVIIPKTLAPLDGMQISFTTSIILLVIYLITAAISVAIAGVLAFPFARKKTSIILVYLAILVPCLYGGAYHLHEYLIYKQLGMINTLFPLIIGSISAIWMIPLLAIYLYRPDANSLENTRDYISSILPAGLILFAMQFTFSWGNMMRPLLFMYDMQRAPLPLIIRQLASGGQQSSLALNLMLVLPILVVWGVVGCVCAFKKSSTTND